VFGSDVGGWKLVPALLCIFEVPRRIEQRRCESVGLDNQCSTVFAYLPEPYVLAAKDRWVRLKS
jgi:hypothetical protein